MKSKSTEQSNNTCPAKAEVLIEQLRQVEVFLGNIPDSLSWSSTFVNKISERTFLAHEQVFDEHKVNYIFRKIVKNLHEEGFSTETITNFINRRLKSSHNLNYCSNNDVVEALNHKN